MFTSELEWYGVDEKKPRNGQYVICFSNSNGVYVGDIGKYNSKNKTIVSPSYQETPLYFYRYWARAPYVENVYALIHRAVKERKKLRSRTKDILKYDYYQELYKKYEGRS